MSGLGDINFGQRPWFPALGMGMGIMMAGYVGYSAASERQRTDRTFREELTHRLAALRHKLMKTATNLDDDSFAEEARRIDRLKKHFGETRHASVVFGTTDIPESDLDALYAYDKDIVKCVDQLDTCIDERSSEMLPAMITRLADLVDKRESFILRLRAV